MKKEQITEFVNGLNTDHKRKELIRELIERILNATNDNKELPVATNKTLGIAKYSYMDNGKSYGIKINANGEPYVTVPWTDTNTTYSAATTANLGLVKQAAKVSKPADNTAANLKTAIDAIIDALITAGIMQP